MAFSMLRLGVRDYETWMSFMEGFADMRAAAGCSGVKVYQSADDGNDVMVVLEWSDLDDARKFSESPALMAVMQKAGVVEASTTLYAEGVAVLDN